jgi:hypothetical protein
MKLLFRICFFLFLVGGTTFQTASAQKINNYKNYTDKHVRIKGSNILMIPPMNFDAASDFLGFQNMNNPGSSIVIIETNKPVNAVLSEFTEAKLRLYGMIFNSQKAIEVGKQRGVWIDIDQQVNMDFFSKKMLIYGDDKSSIIINGVFPRDSVEQGKDIVESMKSIFVHEGEDLSERLELTYSLDESKGNLMYCYKAGNGLVFNRDGKTPTQTRMNTSIITGKVYHGMGIDNKRKFCEEKLRSFPIDYQTIPGKELESISLDGLKGYILYAENLDRDDEETMQIIVFDDQNKQYYMFMCAYPVGDNSAKADVMRVLNTFKRK